MIAEILTKKPFARVTPRRLLARQDYERFKKRIVPQNNSDRADMAAHFAGCILSRVVLSLQGPQSI